MTARTAWRVAGAAGGLMAAVVLRLLSAADLGPTGAAAVVRLSWSARPEFIERCRRLTDAELASRPAHMRMRFDCDGEFARYRLRVSLNDAEVADDTVRGGGLRHDRPLQVLREFAATPGSLRLRVELSRLDSLATDSAAAGALRGVAADTLLAARAAREVDERRRRAAEAIPPILRLDTLVPLAPRRVVLVTYDGANRRLIARMER